ncbi:MAG: TIGR02300 family protein [OCS116 cluster bacterium]|nr:TIGR02300 family protein [OCS116 cluster bacterium]
MAARPDLGIKMECSSCGERFFDLNRTPITCPKCDYVYPTTEEKVAPVVEEKPKEEKTEEATNTNEDTEFVSLEEADAATISELTGSDDDDTANPDEDSFLEEDGTSTNVEDISVPISGADENDS